MGISKFFLALSALASVSVASVAGAQTRDQVAQKPPAPVYLQLEITSTCTDRGALFKVINRGTKWPRMGTLRLYGGAGKNTEIGMRRLRLASGQKVSFMVKNKVMNGAPVAIWVDPEWYQREMEYDASIRCG